METMIDDSDTSEKGTREILTQKVDTESLDEIIFAEIAKEQKKPGLLALPVLQTAQVSAGNSRNTAMKKAKSK